MFGRCCWTLPTSLTATYAASLVTPLTGHKESDQKKGLSPLSFIQSLSVNGQNTETQPCHYGVQPGGSV